MKHVTIDELTDYVLHDIMPEDSKVLHQHIEPEKMKVIKENLGGTYGFYREF